MSMNKLDENEVRDFYNSTPEIWAKDDQWHQWSRNQIADYLCRFQFHLQDIILNAGSAGNDYGIICNMFHVDIAEEKLKGIQNAVIASIESLPFSNGMFNSIICVGSVINYCDANAVIAEFARVLQPKGILILEFENSAGFEYKGTEIYGKSADVVTVKFQGKDHNQWLFSVSYIMALLKANNFSILDVYPYQICSSLVLHICGNEARSVKYAKWDGLARRIPWLANHANNFILYCQKL